MCGREGVLALLVVVVVLTLVLVLVRVLVVWVLVCFDGLGHEGHATPRS